MLDDSAVEETRTTATMTEVIPANPTSRGLWGVIGGLVLLIIALLIGAYLFWPRQTVTEEPERPPQPEMQEAVAPMTNPEVVEEEEGWEVIDYPNPEGRILPKSLPRIAPDATPSEAAKLIRGHVTQILAYAKHDPHILTYYLSRYGYPEENIPSINELKGSVKLRKDFYNKLDGMMRSSTYKPGVLTGGDWANDGMTPANTRTTQPSNYGEKGVPVVVVTFPNGEKGAYKPVCGNFQFQKPPRGAKVIERHGPKPTEREKKQRKRCPIGQKPPINKYPHTTPHHPGNPSTQPPKENLAGPTQGVDPGVADNVKQGQDANADTKGPVTDGKTGQDSGGTSKDGGNEERSPDPVKPPDTSDDKVNEGDPGGW